MKTGDNTKYGTITLINWFLRFVQFKKNGGYWSKTFKEIDKDNCKKEVQK